MFNIPSIGSGQQESYPPESNYLTNFLSNQDPLSNQARPITLSPTDLERFKTYVFSSYSTNLSRHATLHKNNRRYREIYNLAMFETEDDVIYTSPLSANKVDGVAAQIGESIEQTELFNFSPMHGVSSVEDVSSIAKLVSAYFNREVEMGGSRELFAQDAPKESVAMGTAFAPLGLGDVSIDGEYFWQVENLIPLEDVVIDNLYAKYIWQTNIFWKKKYIMNDLLTLADAGIIDPAESEKLYLSSTIIDTDYYSEANNIGQLSLGYEDDNAQLNLVHGYYRFRKTGDRKSQFIYCIFDPNHRVMLAAMDNPIREIAKMPAMNVWRIGKVPNRFYGRGIIERLYPIQEMMDTELNNYLSVSNLIASPPFEYRADSPFGQAIQRRQGKIRLMAGLAIPTHKSPRAQDDVKTHRYEGNANMFFNNMGFLDRMGDDASYNRAFLGDNQSAKTLGEFQYNVSQSNLKVRGDYADFSYDSMTNAKLFYSALLLKIKHMGVVEVHSGGGLLAYEDIPLSNFDAELTNMLFSYAQNGQTTPENIMQALAVFSTRLDEGRIIGAKRNDLVVALKGTKIIADKVGEFMKLKELLPIMGSWLPAAAQDTNAHYNLRTLLEAADLRDIDKRMPVDPAKTIAPNEVFELMRPALELAMTQSRV